MTNTDTADVDATAAQVRALHQAGSELVRVTVNNEAAADAVPAIVAQVDVPVIGDFHYNGHLLLTKYPRCAAALAKYRINPGNVGAKRRDENFRTIIEVALAHAKPVRIGVNWGSLDQQLLTEMMNENARRSDRLDACDVMLEAMVASTMRSAELAEECGLPHDRIILSAKLSGVQDLVDVYRRLARLSDYPLHLGLTEAGMGTKGIIASAAGLSILLQEGIGDTIRVSLTPRPGGDRTAEVQVAQQIIGEARQPTVHVHQVLHARQLRRQDDAVVRQAAFLGELGRPHRAGHHRLEHDVARVQRVRSPGVLVHHLGEELLVETAPVDADAHGLPVRERHFDDGPEIFVAPLRAHVP